jgi:hypothetical protein
MCVAFLKFTTDISQVLQYASLQNLFRYFTLFKNISTTTHIFVWFRCTNLILKNQHPETKKLTRNNLLQISEANFILHKDRVLKNGSV